jgi:hypothetical protein
MRGVLARASSRDRPVRHHPAHAMPSPGRTRRIRTSGHDHGARHARVSIETRRSLAELRQRLTRLAHAPRIADRVVVFADAQLSARHWGARPVQTRAFRVALFICVVSTGFITAAPSLSAGDGGPPPTSSVAHRPPLQIASGPAASRLNASGEPLRSAASETAATPPVGGPHQDRSDSTRGGLSLDMQTPTPPAPDDPDLEQALSGLDRQADLDQMMSQQRGLGDQPPTGLTAGHPAAVPDGRAPVPPPLSTSSTNGLPPHVGPSTTATPNAKPSSAYSGQRASSRWISHG